MGLFRFLSGPVFPLAQKHQQTLGHLWDSVAVLHRHCSDL
jgi:hypothetical protein